MRRGSMSAAGWIVTAALLLLAASPPARAESDEKRVQSDVRSMIEALYRGDAVTLLRFTHPQVIQAIGGSEAALAGTKRALERRKLIGVELESLEFPSEPELMKGQGREFAIVHTRIVLSSGGRRVESRGFQLGVKDPGASVWRYIEGSDIDDVKVQMMFPGFPVDYTFPGITRQLL